MISVCPVAFLSFSGYLRSPSWPFSQKAWALFSLLCCLLSITPSASRAMQQKDTEKNGDFPTAPGVIALLVRERIPLPPQSFRHLPGHCCHHYASLTILLGGWGRREGKKYEKKKKTGDFLHSLTHRNSFCHSSVQKERLSLKALSCTRGTCFWVLG